MLIDLEIQLAVSFDVSCLIGYRTAVKHSNNYVFHQCFIARSITPACKIRFLGIDKSKATANLLSDQASDIVWRLYTTPHIGKSLNV